MLMLLRSIKILLVNHGFMQNMMELAMFGDLQIGASLHDSYDEVGSPWLNSSVRCFGDKGDVEDITEGPSQYRPPTRKDTDSSH